MGLIGIGCGKGILRHPPYWLFIGKMKILGQPKVLDGWVQIWSADQKKEGRILFPQTEMPFAHIFTQGVWICPDTELLCGSLNSILTHV